MKADVRISDGCLILRRLRQVGPIGIALLLILWLGGGLVAQVQSVQLAPAVSALNQLTNTEASEVRIEVAPQFQPVVPAKPFVLAVILDIAAGWHLYANPRQGELGIDTEIIPETSEVLKFGEVIYPPGEKYEDKILEASNHIYEGRVVCYLPVEVLERETADWSGGVTVKLRLTGLLCSDAGSCVPWGDKVAFDLQVTVDAGEVKAVQPELFADFDPTAVEWAGVTGETKIPDVVEKSVAGETLPDDPTKASIVMPDYQPREFAEVSWSAGDWLKPILLALAAGLLLNLMPCVLPVIPLKVLSLIQQSQADISQGDRYKPVKMAAVFSGGIILVFVGLAVIMSVFKILYGQQFQSDAFKLVMLVIIFILSLSMFGIFEVAAPGRLANLNIVREGYLGALGMGVLATLLATPCSAPLLGPVLTWSLSKPTIITVAVFLVIGLGMAAPYMVLTAFPSLLERLPKAGNWMLYLKQGLGFVMLGVAAYLIFLFEPGWHLPLIVFCLLLGFALWLGFSVVNVSTSPGRKVWARSFSGVAVLLGAVILIYTQPAPGQDLTENWLVARLLPLHEKGQSVMVEFTADWCPNCKYVEKTVLKRQAFQDKLTELGVELIIADWTQNDPAITEMLTKLGSKSIPFAAIFGGGNPLNPIILRDIYTLETALSALEEAR